MLLERLPPTPVITPTPPTPPEMNPAPRFDVSPAAHTKIPHPALPDALKISWVLLYMKLGCALTYALQ
ncbi:hypothetical protein C0995_007520, partial [Termitomyces sp. Mi166